MPGTFASFKHHVAGVLRSSIRLAMGIKILPRLALMAPSAATICAGVR